MVVGNAPILGRRCDIHYRVNNLCYHFKVERLTKMIDLASKIINKAFADKKDRAGKPYIEHLNRVANSCPPSDELRTIALLHDILEDCPEWNEKSLRMLFPDSVVDSVVALTQKREQPYEDYITQVIENKDAIIVKSYDLIDNMNIIRLPELTGGDFKRLKKYHKAYNRIQEVSHGIDSRFIQKYTL